jgi:hypothetical protein
MRYIYEGFEEGLTTSTITNITDKMMNMPLKQYCIKSSYNSAYDGKNITIKQLKYVMNKGVRFLDFELYLIDNIVYVNYSIDTTYTTFINDNKNEILFSTIMNEITKPEYETPNPNDPLFIQLRIKSKNDSIYTKVAEILNSHQASIYGKQINGDTLRNINGDTLLNELKQKVVIVMDKSINPAYPEDILAPYVNVITGGNTWSSQQYSLFKNQKTTPPKIKDDFKTTDVTQLKLLMPDVDANSPNPQHPFSLIENYGVQAIAYKFYNKDMALDLYETIFAEYQSAFVPLASVLQFIKKNKQEPDEKMTLKYGANFVVEK